MRKLHRALALFFAPFLISSAVTGLLWAYAPYLYLKKDLKPKSVIGADQEALVHLSPLEAIKASGAREKNLKVSGVTLRAEGDRVLYTVSTVSKEGPKDILVNAENGELLPKPANRYPAFHMWVMKIHRLEFFGTKKELVIFPGIGLLSMLFTGLFLFKRGLR